MKNILGNFILDEFVNGDFRVRWLRRITRETKTTYISYCQRSMVSKEECVRRAWSSKPYRKTSDGGVKPIVTHLHNKNGASTLQVITDPSTLKCQYSYDELFNTDIREIQSPDCEPLHNINRMNEMQKGKDIRPLPYILDSTIYKCDPNNTHFIDGWDSPVIKYLEQLFKVPVYRLGMLKISEDDKPSKLSLSGTYFHITHFGDDKPTINFNENYHNRTILFWLFDNKLVFQYETGIDSW